MAPSRLSDRQKQELVERYRAGESSAQLAEAFGCSPNTVSRTVRSALTPEEYEALKKGRAARPLLKVSTPTLAPPVEDTPSAEVSAEEDPASLALEDADDFADDPDPGDDLVPGDPDSGSEPEQEFHTVAVLTDQIPVDPGLPAECRPIGPGVLPESVYMLVDKLVELDPRPLSDFPELGAIASEDQERQSLALFASPRTAKRQCGRNQRVIKIPDSQVFERTTSYLVARGITRLVLDGSLIALDA
ncbi:MAG: hypothetical protein RLZZ216_956 [Cyanobacteriota bacterium]|jgi:transcriptional regulator with XRE-family HTH domain